jgi:hypothetical protein
MHGFEQSRLQEGSQYGTTPINEDLLGLQNREYRLRLYPEWSAAQFRIQLR